MISRVTLYFLFCIVFSISLAVSAHTALHRKPIDHVVLISVDGMHALDLERFIAAHPHSNLAQLANQGIDYTNARGVEPADSLPGLLALVTGGTPAVTGVYYDNVWARELAPPKGPCKPSGAHVLLNEDIDTANGKSVDPQKLARNPRDHCTRVHPWQFLRVNTVFNVVSAAGGYTAWADKHPAYSIVQGPSGHGVDDLYTPEIGQNGEGKNGVKSITSSIKRTEKYDSHKMQAILNEISGLTHSGQKSAPVPNLFGLNLQSMNVAEKIAGYKNGQGKPTRKLEDALHHVDQLVGELLGALKKHHLRDNTLVILTAKHGNGPIDRNKVQHIQTAQIRHVIQSAVGKKEPAQLTADQGALIWLHNGKETAKVAKALKNHQKSLGIRRVLWGRRLDLNYPSASRNSRTPNIIITTKPGVIYAGKNATKLAEHGGFVRDDIRVPLLISSPALPKQGLKLRTPVQTTQVAPTMLSSLGLSPQALKAIRVQGTPSLPGEPWQHLDLIK